MSLFNLTFSEILQRMLDNVSAKYDKREGSVIYDALAPTALEHQRMYIDMGVIENEMFPDTASREYLIRHAAQRGIEPKEATQAVWKAQAMPTSITIPIGTRFGTDTMTLRTIRNEGEGIYSLVCETAGSAGNDISGQLRTVDRVDGLQQMTLAELSEAGSDDETTEELRSRFLEYLKKPPTSGNKNEYYDWAMSVDGVGLAKVFGAGDSIDDETVAAGEVRVYLIDARKRAAGTELLTKAKTYIDSVRPIGASVNVLAASEKAINIKVQVTISGTTDLATLQASFKTAVNEYLQENAMDLKRVSVAKIGDLLFSIDGIEDYTGLTLNGEEKSTAIGDAEIAVIGTVEMEATPA